MKANESDTPVLYRMGAFRMKLTTRLGAVAAILAIVAAAGTGTAIADDISNRLDATVDAVAEVMPLEVGGANGTTNLYLIERNADGKNGCNLTGSTTLILSVSSSDTSKATVSPSSVTFSSCGEEKTLTVTAVAAGSATISVTQTANNTEGTFNLAPATFTVNVTAATPTNTPPTVTVAGVAGGASYNKGSVPAATCQVTDTEDGDSSFAATLSAVTGTYASDGIGSQTASCSYTDDGGLTASGSETYNIVDPSAPVITPTVTGTLGNNGWYTGNVTLTWNVSDADSPNSLQKTGCDNQNVTSDQASTTYTCSATSAGGSSGPVSVSIKRDATAPSVSPASVTDSTWRNTSLSQTFEATDSTSGLADATDASFTLTAAAESASALAPTVVSHTVTDAAGNSTTRSVSALIDETAPVVEPDDVNNTTWRNTPLSEDFTASDGLSGLASSADASFTLEASDESTNATTPTVATRTVYDVAGNSTTRSVSALIDLTEPVIEDEGPTPSSPNGSNGWYTSAVTNEFTATDALSGLASGTSPITVGTGTSEGTGITVSSGPVTDLAGNTRAAVTSAAFNIDLSNPTNVAFVNGPAAGSSHYFGNVPAAPTCTADDAVSGLASCVVTGYSTAVGSHMMTATATDNAGRTATATRSYTVLAWTLNGFYQPVDMGGVWNTVKGGSTVPLKFEIFSGSTELTSTSAIKSFTTAKVSCTSGTGTEDAIEVVTTGGTSLRYDSTGGQFIQNWKTPTGAGTCYSTTMTTLDGSTITALFKIK